MTLGEKQRVFAKNQGQLILWAYSHGYELTGGQWLRTASEAAANAAAGTGIANSLHKISLAMDWNLFINGVYQVDSAAHRPLGDYWKSLDPLNRWGGDFPKPDGNHYSMEHEGVQ